MWYIVRPHTRYARLFWSSTPLKDAEAVGEDFVVAEDLATRQRQIAQNEEMNKYYKIGTCSFCGGSTPCLRDD